MTTPRITGNVVLEYLAEYPELPSLTLARWIYNKNPELFKSIDHVRGRIRYYRGRSGKFNRQKIKEENMMPYEPMPLDTIPEGLKYFGEWVPYEIKGNNTLALFDMHVPYHYKPALQIALSEGRDHGVDSVLIAGDGVDFYGVSFWEKDPRKRRFHEELSNLQEILRIIRKMFPNAEIIYQIGNHEERYFRYMKGKAPELLGLKCLDFDNLIDPIPEVGSKMGIKFVPEKRIVKIGHLNCIHGHEFGKSMFSPVNPARGLYLRGKEIAMCGHHHQTSEHTETTMNDKVIACWSVGCLCDLHPEYLPINKWNHGFAIIEHQDGQDFRVLNRKIINGKVF